MADVIADRNVDPLRCRGRSWSRRRLDRRHRGDRRGGGRTRAEYPRPHLPHRGKGATVREGSSPRTARGGSVRCRPGDAPAKIARFLACAVTGDIDTGARGEGCEVGEPLPRHRSVVRNNHGAGDGLPESRTPMRFKSSRRRSEAVSDDHDRGWSFDVELSPAPAQGGRSRSAVEWHSGRPSNARDTALEAMLRDLTHRPRCAGRLRGGGT